MVEDNDVGSECAGALESGKGVGDFVEAEFEVDDVGLGSDVIEIAVNDFDNRVVCVSGGLFLKFVEGGEVAVDGDEFFRGDGGVEELAVASADEKDDFIGEVVEFAEILGEQGVVRGHEATPSYTSL